MPKALRSFCCPSEEFPVVIALEGVIKERINEAAV